MQILGWGGAKGGILGGEKREKRALVFMLRKVERWWWLWRCCGGSGGEGMVERYAKKVCRMTEVRGYCFLRLHWEFFSSSKRKSEFIQLFFIF